MALWNRLYALVWVLTFDFIVLLLYNRPPDFATWLHIALGLGALGLAYSNWRGLESSAAPARLKRISKATFRFAVAQAVVGVLVFLDWNILLGLFPSGVLGAAHIVIALAMITQASSVATAYDMWEEREYDAPAAAAAGAPSPAAAPG